MRRLLLLLAILSLPAYGSLQVMSRSPVFAAVSHQFLTAISAAGTVTAAQPAFTDVSGTLAGSQLPTFTGDVTNSSAAMTVAKIQGTTVSGTTGTGAVAFSASPGFTGTVTGTNEALTGTLACNSFSTDSIGQWIQTAVPAQAGTVTVTATGTAITGSGTAFLTTFRTGDTITANSETHTITSITSDTAMVSDAWTGNASGVSYTRAATNGFTFYPNGNFLIGDSLTRTTITNLGNSNVSVIGTSAPTTGTSSVPAPALVLFEYSGTNANPATLIFQKSRGTESSPVTISSGDSMGSINWRGYDTSIFTSTAARIIANATQTFTSAAHGTDIIFQTTPNGSTTLGTVLTLDQDVSATFAGAIKAPNLTTSSSATTGTVCWTTSSGNFTVDTTVACLSSTGRIKRYVEPLSDQEGLAEVMALRPISYELKPEFNPLKLGRMVGFIAEEVQKVDPRLIALDAKGDPMGVRYMQLTAVLTKAIQEQQAEIRALEGRVHELEGAH